MIETAQMVVDVLRPGGLAPGGTGVRTAQKVRLMHAGVRHQIAAYPGWNPEFNKPVNPEDMAGTLLSFSWVVIDGLRQLGLHVDERQAEALLHCWNIIGHILGIREELQAHTMLDAEQIASAIQRRHYASCPEGQDMTRALVQMMQQYLPGNLLDPIPPLFVRALLGDRYADMLAVQPIPAPHLLLAVESVQYDRGEHQKFLRDRLSYLRTFQPSLDRGHFVGEPGRSPHSVRYTGRAPSDLGFELKAA